MRRLVYTVLRAFFSVVGLGVGKGSEISVGRCINPRYIKLGKEVALGSNWVVAVYPFFGGETNHVKGVKIGDRTKIGRSFTLYCANRVEIGDDCLFGSNILVTDNEHGMDADAEPYYKQPLVCKDVRIGNGTWVGEKACILSGSDIGEKCIVGAGSVVKGVFPDRCILAGNPARIIKRWDNESHCWKK